MAPAGVSVLGHLCSVDYCRGCDVALGVFLHVEVAAAKRRLGGGTHGIDAAHPADRRGARLLGIVDLIVDGLHGIDVCRRGQADAVVVCVLWHGASLFTCEHDTASACTELGRRGAN